MLGNSDIMKKRIKRFLLSQWPGLYFAISSYLFFYHCKNRFEEFQSEFCEEVYSEKEIQVLSGPFAGLIYYNRIVWGPITPKWIGCYEKELHKVIEKIIKIEYPMIIDVGAAEGYYAVGLASRSPKSSVISYDVDPIARIRQKQLAKLNSVRNLDIRKQCTHKELSCLIIEKSVLISDIEGFELELLNPEKCPELIKCDLLIEVHDYKNLNVSKVKEKLLDNFSSTHTIKEFHIENRDVVSLKREIPELAEVEDKRIAEATNEHRGGMQSWLWMEAEQGAAVNALPRVIEL